MALALVAAAPAAGSAEIQEVKSPDGSIRVRVGLEDGRPRYDVRLDGAELLKPSPLGLRTSHADFTSDLELTGLSRVETVRETYRLLHGKRRLVRSWAQRRVFTFRNGSGQRMEIIFHVANDGLAFRYRLPRLPGGRGVVTEETTGFAFPPRTVVWMHPMHDAKTGWSRVNPSYEEHYAVEAPAGTPSPHAAGWVLPALFRIDDKAWALVTESDADGSYCAARLGREAPDGLYRIAFPDLREHRGEIDPVAPEIRAPFASPWRVIVLGKTLRPIVESTLVTDVARPSTVKDTTFVEPGRAAWSWLQLDDASCVLPVQKEFLDLASRLGWEYLLVDALWDRKIGWEGIDELVRLGRARGVGIWLWYNSNGSWNDAPQTPRDRMHEPAARRAEMALLRKKGVKGIKVDFMGGDKQATVRLYLDILRDAAEHGLMVNFHGSTIPRGWERTYPNLMTMEAVKGMEFVGFEQASADRQPEHCAILPFTRNAIGPMDFTPVVFDPRMRRMDRRTSDAFELALAVLFESGVQHMGLTPPEIEKAPGFVVEALRAIPPAWDDVRFVAGYPGKDVVLARRAGDRYFVAGINGTAEARPLVLDLSFLGPKLLGSLISDGEGGRGFAHRPLAGEPSSPFAITLPPRGGFLLTTATRPDTR